MTSVGAGVPRLEGRGKVTGRLRFTDDLRMAGLCHVRLVVSDQPHARVVAVGTERARALPGVLAILTGDDLPAVTAPGPDQPLARGEVHYVGQPVAAVVAESEAVAADAAQLVELRLEALPAAVDPDAAMADGAPLVLAAEGPGPAEAGVHGAVTADGDEPRPPNCAAATRIRRGDAAEAIRTAAVLVRGRFHVAAAHQGFLEPHTVAAAVGPDGDCTIWSPTQGAFLSRRITAEMLGWPESRIRVVPTPVGGGFGGKILLLEPLIALLAAAVGRPVRLTLTRSEEFLLGRGGPAATLDLTLAGDAQGHLQALHGRVVFDLGAGAEEHAATALDLVAGTYRIPDLDIVGYDVSTHKTPATAYRAPAAPQAYFALESLLDEYAERTGTDPVALRLAHALAEGDVKPNGRRWPRIGMRECLERAAAHPLLHEPVGPDEGVGVAVGSWGGGLEPAAAVCRVERDGTMVLQVGATDLTGSHTVLAALAAGSVGLAADRVRVELSDTGSAPYAGVAGGSKTVYSVGPAVLQAGEEVRRQLLEIAAGELEASAEDCEIEDGAVFVRGSPGQRRTLGELAGLATRFGGRYAPVEALGRVAIRAQAPMFTVHLARVRVDRVTGDVRVTGYAAVQDVGRALNPAAIEGQVHGGVIQGLGRALGEQLAWDEEGQLLTGSFLDYVMPTIEMTPPIAVELVEVPSPHGPLGAKGVGEPPAVPGAAAIANAVFRATGVRLRTLPLDTQQLVAS